MVKEQTKFPVKISKEYYIEFAVRRTTAAIIMVMSVFLLIFDLLCIKNNNGTELKYAFPIVLVYLHTLSVAIFELFITPIVSARLHDFPMITYENHQRSYSFTGKNQFNIDISVNYSECSDRMQEGLNKFMKRHFVSRLTEVTILFSLMLGLMILLSVNVHRGNNIIIGPCVGLMAIVVLCIFSDIEKPHVDREYICITALVDFARVKLYQLQRFEKTLEKIKGNVECDGESLIYEEDGDIRRIDIPAYIEEPETSNNLIITANVEKCIESQPDILDFVAIGKFEKI